MRLAVAYIAQETNTFNPHPSTLDGFASFGIYRGQEMFDKLVGVGTVGGFLSAVDDWGQGVELVPLIKAHDVAGGRLTDDALATLTTELTERLAAAGPLDGLALLLHGACAAASEDDAEGHLLAAARAVVGDQLPIVVGLDHHANITRRMVELSTAIVGHRTQPHDVADTGRLTGELLLRTVAGAVSPVMTWRKLRLLSHQEQYLTSRGPMKAWFDRARDLEKTDGVLSVSPFPMQPWLDLTEGGWSVVVVTDGNRELADRRAEEMAEMAWSMRQDFQITTSVEPTEAVAKAAAFDGLAILSDTGDSVFGGAAGDSTVLLTELLRAGDPTALIPMVDPDAARTLAAAGVGRTVELEVGSALTGWFDRVAVSATVRAVDEPVLRLENYNDPEVRMGTTVVAQVANVTLVVSERPGVAGNHPGMYEHFGLDPAEYGAVVLKTASNFQWFAPLTTKVIRVNTPGPTQSDIRSLPWQRMPRPVYPLDDGVTGWR
jgi:microcystin degradation protein MlrC